MTDDNLQTVKVKNGVLVSVSLVLLVSAYMAGWE